MPRLPLEKILRLTLALGLTGAAFSELSRQPVVMDGLAALGYPSWLVLLLGPAKLAAVLALVLRPHTRLAAAAYVGLLVNVGGAVGSMALTRVALWPDVVVAPTYLLLVAASAALHERARVAASSTERAAAPAVARPTTA